jgi:uncharacterized protein (TIGR00255 family)
MIASMTAYGRAEGAGEWGQATWEIRSVNHRYLEASVRLPEDLRMLENTFREHISSRLKRGKVDCTLRFETDTSAASELSINSELAQKLINSAESLQTTMKNPAPVSSIEILRWPGVIDREALDLEQIGKPLLQLLDTALETLIEARKREGEKIHGMITERCNMAATKVIQVRELLPAIMDGLRDKWINRARELNSELDNDRLEQEMLLVAQKMDVAEELDRLDAHIEEVKRALDETNPVGRRLDFLMQEMNREANTLGSKSAHIDSSNASVDLKVLIEQMREQIQNIE